MQRQVENCPVFTLLPHCSYAMCFRRRFVESVVRSLCAHHRRSAYSPYDRLRRSSSPLVLEKFLEGRIRQLHPALTVKNDDSQRTILYQGV